MWNSLAICCNYKRGGKSKMNLIYYIDDMIIEEDKKEENYEPQPLYVENIRPQDLPPNDGPFPRPPPNKRVIIIDL